MAEPALSYGELIVDFTSPAALKEHLNELQAYLSSHYPQAYVRMKQYNLMYMDFPIQFMISGPDPAVLKSLCAQVEGIMRADSSVMLVTNNWGPETPAMRVDYQQQTARDVNLSREDVGLAVLAATDGLPIGSYYEGEHPLPIYLKSVNDQGQRPGQIGNVPVWSMVPSTNGIGLGTVKELMTGMIGTDDVLKRLIGSVPLNQASREWKSAGKYRSYVVITDSVLLLYNVITLPDIRLPQPEIACFRKSRHWIFLLVILQPGKANTWQVRSHSFIC